MTTGSIKPVHTHSKTALTSTGSIGIQKINLKENTWNPWQLAKELGIIRD